MNVYDFDKTIYDGDSTVDFYRYCLCRQPSLVFCVPRQVWGFFQYTVGRINTTSFKECFFCFLPKLASQNELVEKFWDSQEKKIKAWYLAQRRNDDVIVSASPTFLLLPICKRLGVAPPIATEVDPTTGKIERENCKGEEKVKRFLEIYPVEEIEAFYSDSPSDVFLARRAKEAFYVQKNAIREWRF